MIRDRGHLGLRLALVAIVTAGCPGTAAEAAPRAQLEARLKAERKLLIEVPFEIPAAAAALSVRFTPATLKTHELYLRHRQQERFVFVTADGRVEGVAGPAVPPLRQQGELLLARDGGALFLDARTTVADLPDWQVYWVATQATKPAVEKLAHPRRELADGFMRKDLLADSPWRVVSGDWRLRQHGGGMPTTEAEVANYNVQRAVNPFSVLGSGNGELAYGTEPWVQAYAEARFYFGVPRVGNLTEVNTLPVGTDLLVVQGTPDVFQVAFGWCGAARHFVLQTRAGTGHWETVWTAADRRPPLTNWVKLGLAVRAGCVAEGWLDDQRVVTHVLPRFTAGPPTVRSGADPGELDDVRAWTLPRPPSHGTPLFVQSRQFAGKQLKQGSDPLEFRQWTQSTDTFVERVTPAADGWQWTEIVSRMPLLGDFEYESVPHDPKAGDLPPGVYELRLWRQDPREPLELERLPLAWKLELLRDELGWTCRDLPALAPEKPEFTLRLRRRATDGDRLTVEVQGQPVPVSAPLPGPLHFSIARLQPAGADRAYPQPQHHMVYAANLTHEFFEEAPTDWNWVEGAFRMDSRWACQDQWNFMACGALGVPFMASKRRYTGVQEHEYFISIRPVYPWDIGDTAFSYDPTKDPGWGIFIQHHGWYNRHDLNFAFCCDGRNPLSGYAIVYAGNDNAESLLLRRGQVVARSQTALIPREPDHSVVHWRWWKFHVRKYGQHVRVLLNDQPYFDYDDPEPLDGGHVGFWSVRNGFVVARLVSTGEQVTTAPQFLYVPDSAPSPWQPLLRDAVTLTHAEGPLHTKVTANVGAGFLAVRYTPPTPVALDRTPVLSLPLKIQPGTRVNLHLRIGAGSYLLQATGPLTDMKSLLTSEFEAGEQFQRVPWPENAVLANFCLGQVAADGDVRFNLADGLRRLGQNPAGLELTDITVGNTSNTDYLQAGAGGNQAGATYLLGTPTFLAP